jgi:hypothetical protein
MAIATGPTVISPYVGGRESHGALLRAWPHSLCSYQYALRRASSSAADPFCADFFRVPAAKVVQSTTFLRVG